jgi:hypothetical protein
MEERKNRPQKKYTPTRNYSAERRQTSERKFIIGRQPLLESFGTDTNI